MKSWKFTRAALVPALAIAGLAVGVSGANAATVGPDADGVPQTLHFSVNESTCYSTQALYQSEDAHILVGCHDPNAGTLGEALGYVVPDWQFTFQWT
ncbi:hypothetical protein [Humibacter sp.]|uniref:hypothetical protein n=1 Tax=Humibacter sp. TaxID=1940291 RepID=UPI003F80CBA1